MQIVHLKSLSFVIKVPNTEATMGGATILRIQSMGQRALLNPGSGLQSMMTTYHSQDQGPRGGPSYQVLGKSPKVSTLMSPSLMTSV